VRLIMSGKARPPIPYPIVELQPPVGSVSRHSAAAERSCRSRCGRRRSNRPG